MTQELTNIIELIKAGQYELAYELFKGNPSIYEDCSEEEFFNGLIRAFQYNNRLSDNYIPDYNKWKNNCPNRKAWLGHFYGLYYEGHAKYDSII